MLRALLLLFGVILLLPGACSLGFMAAFLGSGSTSDVGLLSLLWLFCFAVSFGGIMMIRRAVVGPRPLPSDPPT